MMSSASSPDQQEGHPGKSPISNPNLGFLKSLTDRRTTRDGNPPKRRGPKPDSKPALTRRQELNRQAQRTHRERKELYIKALEDEVMRLREIFSHVSQDKERLAEENRQLRNALMQSDIATSGFQGADDMASVSGQSTGQGSQTVFTPPLTSQSTAPSTSPTPVVRTGPHHGSLPHSPGIPSAATYQSAGNRGDDYDQAGIDFVLTLEKPCMSHVPFLMERAAGPGGEPCGHALMASCPPGLNSELSPDIPFGDTHACGDLTRGQRTWEPCKADLATLLDLSGKLDLDGEITPVMAWGIILSHPRFCDLRPGDFVRLADDLKDKVRCYGFGAVMEEFELRDALENIFSTKQEFEFEPVSPGGDTIMRFWPNAAHVVP